jgi:hypothetical protein
MGAMARTAASRAAALAVKESAYVREIDKVVSDGGPHPEPCAASHAAVWAKKAGAVSVAVAGEVASVGGAPPALLGLSGWHT